MTPLRFHDLLVPKIWGGDAIAKLKGKKRASAHIGESFELSALPGEETYCATEGYEGRTLPQLIAEYGAELVGSENFRKYGTQFPILIKFIDAQQPLSVQVHPDDAMAQRLGMPYGKSEMWYVAGTQPDASLMAGFNEDVNPDDFESLLSDGSLMQRANTYATHVGDAFYIPAGTLHSIGAGNLIIEVQQSSGATYRVYDFNRRDAFGHQRELHVDLARQALDFSSNHNVYHRVDQTLGKITPVIHSPYFTTSLLQLSHADTTANAYHLDLSDLDSFVAIVTYKGSAQVTDNEGHQLTIEAGGTILVPASTQWLDFTTETDFACLLASV